MARRKGSTGPIAPYPLGDWDEWGRGLEGIRDIGVMDRPRDSLLTTNSAWLGCICNRFVMAETVFPFAYASRYFPKVTNIRSIPEASKNTCFVGSPVLQARESCTQLYAKVTVVPVTTRQSIPKLPWSAPVGVRMDGWAVKSSV